VARELLNEIRRRTRTARDLEREIGALVKARAPQLLDLTGCGILTAAKLLAETAGAERFATDAKFARLAGVAPVPAPPASGSAIGSTVAATASSTAHFTASR
jgi:transposase